MVFRAGKGKDDKAGLVHSKASQVHVAASEWVWPFLDVPTFFLKNINYLFDYGF